MKAWHHQFFVLLSLARIEWQLAQQIISGRLHAGSNRDWPVWDCRENHFAAINLGAFSQLLSTYWRLLPLFVVAALFKSAWFKGFIGEVMVNLSALLFQDEYVHSNNSTTHARQR